MGNLFVILICLAIGLALQKDRRLPDSLASSLNTYVIYVALPALVLFEIQGGFNREVHNCLSS